MPLNWTTKTDGFDDVLAADFNELVNSIETELNDKEDKSNKVTTLSADNTDEQYPSAKATFNTVSSQMASVSIALQQKVSKTDYASADAPGIVSVKTLNGLSMTNSDIRIYPATTNGIDTRTTMYQYHPITVGNLDYAVRSVRPIVNTSGDFSSVLTVNTIYKTTVKSTLSPMLPASAQYGDFIQIDFISGSIPTALTIMSNAGLGYDDFTPETNKLYTLFFDWGMIGFNSSTNTVTEGWRFGYAKYPYTEG